MSDGTSPLTLTEARALAVVARPCRACGTPLWFVPSPATGKLQPLAEDPAAPGQMVNHFATCPKAARFRRRGRAPPSG